MGRYAKAAKRAQKLTNKQLATEMASIGPMDRTYLQKLLPRKRDKEYFLALMKEVESEKTQDEKLEYLEKNVRTAGRVALKVLKFFV